MECVFTLLSTHFSLQSIQVEPRPLGVPVPPISPCGACGSGGHSSSHSVQEGHVGSLVGATGVIGKWAGEDAAAESLGIFFPISVGGACGSSSSGHWCLEE